MFKRYCISFAMALVIVTILFAIMIALIKTSEVPVDSNANANFVEFIRSKKDNSLQLEEFKPDPPPAPESPPPPAQLSIETAPTSEQSFSISAQNDMESLSVDPGFFSDEGDGEYLPIYQVPPQYPRQALMNRVEGWVVVEFTIDTQGQVKSPRVIDSTPKGVFDSAALNAVKRFRFKPRTLAGTPIEVQGIRNRIRFSLKK